MPRTNFEELLKAGVHFGHLKRKWNPNMAPYIFMERNGIHIIDLHKTVVKLDIASEALKQIAKSGRKILFVATKKQAKEIVAEKVKAVNMPYVTERWSGGMLTNFPTIRKAIKKMATIDKMAVDGTFKNISKRERLQITRQREKLETNLGSIADMTRIPAAIFIVDVNNEYIAVNEAKKLNIPIFGMVDTNSEPKDIDFVIPSNDDASASISLIMDIITESIREGLNDRKLEREKEDKRRVAKKEAKKDAAKKAEPKKEVKAEKEPAKKAPVAPVEKAPAKKVEEKVAVAKKEPKKEVKKEEPKKKEVKKAPAKKDKLEKVEGIGPKIAEVFNNAGINTFAELAETSIEKLQEILVAAGPRLASKKPNSWPKQAKMAAEGKWDELKEWQDAHDHGIE